MSARSSTAYRPNLAIFRWPESLGAAGLERLLLDRHTPEHSGAGVRLANMHRVKGLEFPHVIVACVNGGVIPYIYSDGSPLGAAEILQERCLLHVAGARARDTLTITSWDNQASFQPGENRI